MWTLLLAAPVVLAAVQDLPLNTINVGWTSNDQCSSIVDPTSCLSSQCFPCIDGQNADAQGPLCTPNNVTGAPTCIEVTQRRWCYELSQLPNWTPLPPTLLEPICVGSVNNAANQPFPPGLCLYDSSLPNPCYPNPAWNPSCAIRDFCPMLPQATCVTAPGCSWDPSTSTCASVTCAQLPTELRAAADLLSSSCSAADFESPTDQCTNALLTGLPFYLDPAARMNMFSCVYNTFCDQTHSNPEAGAQLARVVAEIGTLAAASGLLGLPPNFGEIVAAFPPSPTPPSASTNAPNQGIAVDLSFASMVHLQTDAVLPGPSGDCAEGLACLNVKLSGLIEIPVSTP